MKIPRMPFWALVPCLAVFLAVGAAQANLNIGTNFTGQTMVDEPALNSGFRFIPPDTDGAVGPNHIVELINGAFAVYNKIQNPLDPKPAPVMSLGLDAFWKAAGVTPDPITDTRPIQTFDPRVVYDPVSAHWFASSLDRGTGINNNQLNNNYLLAVSNFSDPNTGWTGYKITGAGAARFTDFDTLGYNQDKVYLDSNNFGANVTTSIIAVPKTDLINHTLNVNTIPKFENQNPNDTGFSIQPLVDPNRTGTELLYSAYNVPAGFLKLSQLNNTNTNNPTLAPVTNEQFISVTPHSSPPPASQPDSPPNNIDAGDTRFGSHVVRGGDGKVWGVQGVESGGHAALRWVQIDPDTNALIQEGLIAKAGFDYYYGSIAVNSKGCVVIGFSGSSDTPGPNEVGFISAYATEGTTTIIGGKPVTTFDPNIKLLKAGTHSYFENFGSGDNRWGDYSATWVDPTNDNIFWTIQEWASDPYNFTSGLGDTWSTQITELIPAPLPSTLIFLGSGLFGLAGWRRRCG